MTPDEQTGSRIRTLRVTQGRSQADLAGPGMSASYLSMIESGSRVASPAALRHLAARLGATVEFLAQGLRADTRAESDSTVRIGLLALRAGRPEEALALLDGLDDPAAAAGRLRALESLDRLDEATDGHEEFLGDAEPGSLPWADRAVGLVRCYLAGRDLFSAAELGERALAVYEERGLLWADEATRLALLLAEVRAQQGDRDDVGALLDRIGRAAATRSTPRARAEGYADAARHAHEQGRFREAHALSTRALALFTETDRALDAANLRALTGVLLAESRPDRLGEAVRLLDEARTDLLGHDAPSDLSRCELALAGLLVRADDPARGRLLAQATLDRAPEAHGTQRAHAHIVLAEASYADEDHSGAATALAAATDLLAALPTGDEHATRCWHRAALLHQKLGSPEDAMHAYDQALRAAGHTLAPPTRARTTA
ncbi:helix-turn-helix domain-containing protein [Streptomyces sp. LMG1-1-1.1]|uniref:helix-turn-helix domain-containing protein n=1 Tax=Streptomyces sp. LMG1-1-1.1 TaxID=3135245 RepID=UPI003467980A